MRKLPIITCSVTLGKDFYEEIALLHASNHDDFCLIFHIYIDRTCHCTNKLFFLLELASDARLQYIDAYLVLLEFFWVTIFYKYD